MLRKFLIFFSILIVFVFFFGWYEITKKDISDRSFISEILSDEIKDYLRKTLFYIPTLQSKYNNLFEQFEIYEHSFNEINLIRSAQWSQISKVLQNGSFISKKNFSRLNSYKTGKTETINEINNDSIYYNKDNFKYKLDKFYLPFLDRNSWLKKPTAYIEVYNEKLWLASADGLIFYSDIKNLTSEEIEINFLKSNITQIINDERFYQGSGHSVKDILIDENYIYLSYTKEQDEDCYNTSIIRALINFTSLEFEDFFSYEECQSLENEEYVAIQSGGRLEKINEELLLFSIGEYRNRILAQDENSFFGKIISLNINNKKYEIISKGHRNPQGLYYDNSKNLLLMTEHGPKGGDELNINKEIKNDTIENYGWPISSYGKHYDGKEREEAPLHKSHLEYGFLEPLKYYVPSIAISDIEKIKIKNNTNNQILISSMGSNTSFGGMSIHYLEYDQDYSKIISNTVIPINERVRDIEILNEEQNLILLLLESSPAIGVLKLEYTN